MTLVDHNRNVREILCRLTSVVAIVFCAALCAAMSASANFEQVGTFAGKPGVLEPINEPPPEEVELGGLSGMAVNWTGAGGVPKGTVYATDTTMGADFVGMFEPAGEGGLRFVEGWNVQGVAGQFAHCGPTGTLPDGEGVHPACSGRRWSESGTNSVDVDVDQATGNVFVYGGFIASAPRNEIVEYTSMGGSEITRFGSWAPENEHTPISESPGEIHRVSRGRIAVNAIGDVYVSDEDGAYSRLAVFAPSTLGNYEHYIYSGEVDGGPTGLSHAYRQPVTDAEGNVYVAGYGVVQELAPELPGPYPTVTAAPVCEFTYENGGIESLAVDPESGEVFFYSENVPKKITRLASCKEGTFVQAGQIAFSPNRTNVQGLIFDPGRMFAAGRPPGVLYAGAGEYEGGKIETQGSQTRAESSLGYIFSRPPEVAPTVEGLRAVHTTAFSSVLEGSVNPRGSVTRYVFEYETDAQYAANASSERFAGSVRAPVGGAVAGEGAEAVAVSSAVTGLIADTEYRFRIVASSHCSAENPEKVCETVGEDGSFHTFPVETSGLPDGRVFELVSPAQKNGGEVLPADPSLSSCPQEGACKPGGQYTHFPMQSAPSGDAVVYQGTPFDPEGGGVVEDEYTARRDAASGWSTTRLTPDGWRRRVGINGYDVVDTNLTRDVLFSDHSLGRQEGFSSLYAQATGDPAVLTPLSVVPEHRSDTEFTVRYLAASADLSRVFFAANDSLTGEVAGVAPLAPEVAANEYDLYEWQPQTGQIVLVNVLPGNAVGAPGAQLAGFDSAHAVSEDGDRVFWSSNTGQVYVRENGERTIELQDHTGQFRAASGDGSVILLSDGCLYDLQTSECEDLTRDREGVHRGGFVGVAGNSEDLSHVYFIDSEVLTGEEENEHCTIVANKKTCETATVGKDNLYAWSTGTVPRFVATLDANDESVGSEVRDWAPGVAARTAQASPNGAWFAFVSYAPVAGYDNSGPCVRVFGVGLVTGACTEVFVYEAASGRLRCVSCDRSGAKPLGRSTLRVIDGGRSIAHYLTDQGRLFFDSGDSLVPADANEGVEDVYEYEPQAGPGEPHGDSCQHTGGCVLLLSSGSGVYDSNFLAADPTGANVFFTTREKLVHKDTDELIDLYDTRENGGIPTDTQTEQTTCKESCQTPVSTPTTPTPASTSYEGAGNTQPTPAKKPTTTKHKQNKHKNKRTHRKRRATHSRVVKHHGGGAK